MKKLSIAIIVAALAAWAPRFAAQQPAGSVASALPSFAEPGISPDGSTIAFVSGGDIWEVPARGGDARLLVSHPATESRPLFSPDGKRLAFTSTRTGDGDVYVLSLATGDLHAADVRRCDGAGDRMVAGRQVALLLVEQPRDLSGMFDVYRVAPTAARRCRSRRIATRPSTSPRRRRPATWWRSPRAPTPDRSGGARATAISTRARSGSCATARRAGRSTSRSTTGRREGRVADVGRRRQGRSTSCPTAAARRTSGRCRASPCRARPQAREGGHDLPRRPRAVADDLEGRQDDRVRARLRHLDRRYGVRARRARCRSRCAARPRPPASSIARFTDQIAGAGALAGREEARVHGPRRDLLRVGEGRRRRRARHDDGRRGSRARLVARQPAARLHVGSRPARTTSSSTTSRTGKETQLTSGSGARRSCRGIRPTASGSRSSATRASCASSIRRRRQEQARRDRRLRHAAVRRRARFRLVARLALHRLL